MKISTLPVLCVILTGIASPIVRAEDNPAQAAARLALAKAMFEQAPATNAAPTESETRPVPVPATKAAEPSANNQPVVVAPAAAPEAPQVAPAAPSAAPASSPSTSATASSDNPAQAAARLALAKQMFELGAQSSNTSTAPAVSEKKAATPTAKPEVMSESTAAKISQQPEAKAAAEHAALATAATPAANKPEKKEKAKPEASDYAGKELGMKPIAAPALPISASKEEQLQALLAKYKADQLTPEQYHKQRAAILAQP